MFLWQTWTSSQTFSWQTTLKVTSERSAASSSPRLQEISSQAARQTSQQSFGAPQTAAARKHCWVIRKVSRMCAGARMVAMSARHPMIGRFGCGM
jgi:hypothetical protein